MLGGDHAQNHYHGYLKRGIFIPRLIMSQENVKVAIENDTSITDRSKMDV